MSTMSLEIDDGFLPHFKAILESFVKDKKVKVLEENDESDYTSACPPELIVSSVEEVRRRVYVAEERIKQGGGISENEFWKKVDEHLEQI